MANRIVLLILFVLPQFALADANDGEFMGYKLGDTYKQGPATQQQTTTTGNLFVTAENPVKPDDVQQVTLLATAESMEIGYIAASSWFDTEAEARAMGRRYVQLLRAKYNSWHYGPEVMDAKMNIVEVNLDRSPYNLRLDLNTGEHDNRLMWRFSMTLGWQMNSDEEQAWREVAQVEHRASRKDSEQKLLDNADVRGL